MLYKFLIIIFIFFLCINLFKKSKPRFIKSPGDTFLNLGLIRIRWYGLLSSISALIILKLSSHLAIKKGLSSNLIEKLFPSLVIFSIIFARIYYVIFEWTQYSGKNFFASVDLFNNKIKIPSFLAVWNGGMSIHGALFGGLIAVIIFCKKNNYLVLNILDVFVPSIALGQAIHRWGNFFNNESFGTPTDLPWKIFIPIQNRPVEIINYQFFHPTFLYESIWNLLNFIILLYLFNININGLIKLKDGTLTYIYIMFYSFGRFWIEGLRIDPLCIGGLQPFCEGGLRVNQLVSIILFVISILKIIF